MVELLLSDMTRPKFLDVIATLNPIPTTQLTDFEQSYVQGELPSGSVGTIVEVYDSRHNHNEGEQYLIEFSDSSGREYAMATLNREEILVLHYEPDLQYQSDR